MGAGASPSPAGPTLAWPLLASYTALVLYASLFPFEGWRDQGVAPWAFLAAPWPRYWTFFDLAVNWAGYVPLGALLTWALLRQGRERLAPIAGVLAPALLALCLEAAQTYLPTRVPSRVDALLNAAGALTGALLAALLTRSRSGQAWTRWRADWQQPGGHAAWAVLMLWPWAVLYPSAVPFGAGQTWPWIEPLLQRWLIEWAGMRGLPIAVPRLVAPGPLAEALLVALCLWFPLLLGYASLRRIGQRLVWASVFAAAAWGIGTLSAALTFDPSHALAWWTPPVQLASTAFLLLASVSLLLPARSAALLAMLVGGWALGVLNHLPPPAYLDAALQAWEQGRYRHLHGALRWLGWLWPYLALVVAARLALRRPR